MARRWSRWLPAAVAPAAVAGAVVLASTSAAVDLPDRSAEDLLELMGERNVSHYSGTFEQTSELGLPELPGDLMQPGTSGSANPADLLAALTGSHSGRIFIGGPSHARLQVMDSFAERNVVLTGEELWVYDSQEDAATHMVLPEHSAAPSKQGTAELPSPEQVADHLLALAEPSTDVSVGPETTVAGRAAYELVLTPRTAETLVASVAIAVDAESGLPLSVTIRAQGQEEPAFRAAYTSVDLSRPDPARFEFTPPPGAEVEELALPEHEASAGSPVVEPHDAAPGAADERAVDPGPRAGHPGSAGPRPDVTGSGWETVVEVPGAAAALPTDEPLVAELTREVAGGRLLSTALVNVLLTDDGRVLVGSVPLERLQAAAAS